MVKPAILIVEDEPSQREILCYNLEAEGYEVLIAENGEEALLVVDEASPDIILLDWMMPLVSGIEVCRRLKLNRETREIPIIMLSARSEEVDKVRGLETGADDYMIKPYSVINYWRGCAASRAERGPPRWGKNCDLRILFWTLKPLKCFAITSR